VSPLSPALLAFLSVRGGSFPKCFSVSPAVEPGPAELPLVEVDLSDGGSSALWDEIVMFCKGCASAWPATLLHNGHGVLSLQVVCPEGTPLLVYVRDLCVDVFKRLIPMYVRCHAEYF
jgi:hypothetical protein